MQATPLIMLALTLGACVLGWSYSRGHGRSVPLALVWLVVALALAGAGGSQSAGAVELSELLNMAAFVLSLAGLAAGPALWEAQMQAHRRDPQSDSRWAGLNVLMGRVWGTWVTRLGAGGAAICWLSLYVVAIGANLAIGWSRRPEDDRTILLLALAAPAAFGLLGTLWMYRAARR